MEVSVGVRGREGETGERASGGGGGSASKKVSEEGIENKRDDVVSTGPEPWLMFDPLENGGILCRLIGA